MKKLKQGNNALGLSALAKLVDRWQNAEARQKALHLQPCSENGNRHGRRAASKKGLLGHDPTVPKPGESVEPG